MSKELIYAQVTVSIAFDREGNCFDVQGAVNGNGADKLSNFAASAISGAILPVVQDVATKVAVIYGEVGDGIYEFVQKEMDALDEAEKGSKAHE